MDIHNKLKALEDHFVVAWMMLATVGYIILSALGQLDFRQYVLFLVILVAIYVSLKRQTFFWFVFSFFILYLVFIKTNFTNSPTVAKIDQVFSQSVHTIVEVMRGTNK